MLQHEKKKTPAVVQGKREPGGPASEGGGGLKHQLRGLGYDAGAAQLSPGAGLQLKETKDATTFKSGDPKSHVSKLHPKLQSKATALIENANKRGLNVWIFEGLRSIERQDALYAQGRTKPGQVVTWVKGGGSYHNYGLAIDVVFWGSAPWGETHDWTKLGEAGEAAGLEWGGRWKNSDRPHFQMPGLSMKQVKGWYAGGGMERVWANVGGGGGGGETDKPTEKVEEKKSSSPGGSYTVKSGDTLGKIASLFLGDAGRWGEIAKLNDISDPRKIRVGQVLQLPGGAKTDAKTDDSKAKEEKDKAGGDQTDGGLLPGATTYTVTDACALVRTPPNDLKSTGKKIPKGETVEIVKSTNVRGQDFVLVQQVMPKGVYDPPQLYGWTVKSNLGGFENTTPVKKEDKKVVTKGDDGTLAATDKIDLSKHSGLDRKMADIYNTKGSYLKDAASALGISPAAAAAVLKVESGGAGFSSLGKMIIRFENHVFYKRWGKANSATFQKHFRYGAGQSWKGHEFRADANGSWGSFHGNQGKEWDVLEFARKLNNDAALQSISMGIAQIMGFNYAGLGYSSVQEMFDHMAGGLRPQLDGMFSFIKNKKTCIDGLRGGDYVKFATGYNGSGQAASYGALIETAAKAYARVSAGRKHA